MQLTICYLYSSGMNVYGDRGNVLTLAQRCRWRGIEVEIVERGIGEGGPSAEADLIIAGGGQDRDQIAVSQDLQGDAGLALREAIEGDAVVLTICGTYQLLGHYFKTGTGETLPGIGVFDATTIAGTRRQIGDTLIECKIGDQTIDLVGFENHSGRTFLGAEGRSLGRVIVGAGNNGDDELEGAVYRNAFGTYLHGPLLPKNPRFADLLIARALRHRYRGEHALETLDDSLEDDAHRRMVQRVRQRGRVKSGAR